MGAMPVAIIGGQRAVNRIVAIACPPAKLVVGDTDAGVDDIGPHIGASGKVDILAVQWQIALIIAVQPPDRTILDGVDAPFPFGSFGFFGFKRGLMIDRGVLGCTGRGILFNVGDPLILLQAGDGIVVVQSFLEGCAGGDGW